MEQKAWQSSFCVTVARRALERMRRDAAQSATIRWFTAAQSLLAARRHQMGWWFAAGCLSVFVAWLGFRAHAVSPKEVLVRGLLLLWVLWGVERLAKR